MKEVQKSAETEPTLKDVMGAVETLAGTVSGLAENLQDLTVAVQEGFAKVEERFDGIDARLDHHEGLLTRHEKILKTLVAGQDNLLERVNVIDQRLTKTQTRVEDAVDEYDHRIAVLEKA